MLFEYLEYIRKQPVPTRRRFALTVSIVLTGCIVLVWLSTRMIDPTTSNNPRLSVPDDPPKSGFWDNLKHAATGDPLPSEFDTPESEHTTNDLPREALGSFENTFREPKELSATSTIATSTSENVAGGEARVDSNTTQ